MRFLSKYSLFTFIIGLLERTRYFFKKKFAMKSFLDHLLFIYFKIWYFLNKPFFKLILVLSDTHSAINPYIHKRIKLFDIIIHAGDISTIDTLKELAVNKKVYAVAGNTETIQIDEALKPELFFTIDNVNIYVTHEIEPYTFKKYTNSEIVTEIMPGKPDVVIFGHTHKTYKRKLKGVLFLNPGSAGPKRDRTSSASFAVLKLRKGKTYGRIFNIPFSYYSSHLYF